MVPGTKVLPCFCFAESLFRVFPIYPLPNTKGTIPVYRPFREPLHPEVPSDTRFLPALREYP